MIWGKKITLSSSWTLVPPNSGSSTLSPTHTLGGTTLPDYKTDKTKYYPMELHSIVGDKSSNLYN